jgi:polar amino acid transport system substrate-binding protein
MEDQMKSISRTIFPIIMAFMSFAGPAWAGAALDKIKASGKLVYCSDLSAPPFLYIDPKTLKPTGFDIAVGTAVAKAMGLTAEFKNIGFDGLVPALQAGQCDAIISSLYDKPARREVVDFVDYAIVGNAVIARSDSPLFVKDLQELSGKKLTVERGSVNEQEAVEANKALEQAGKPQIAIVTLPKMSDAIQQMVTGLSDSFYGGTATVAIYNMTNKGALKLASPQTSSFPTGIATVKADSDVHDAIKDAFQKIRDDGAYDDIVKTWSFESMAMKP